MLNFSVSESKVISTQRKRIIAIAVLMFIALSLGCTLNAQNNGSANQAKNGKIVLKGRVFSRSTSKDVHHVRVRLLRQDSSEVAKTEGFQTNYYYTGSKGVYRDSTSNYTLEIPKAEGNYIIETSREGYETKYTPYPLLNLKSRETEREIPNIFMTPEGKVTELGEVTVKTSKIVFYNKGDTIVYNADAFNLPEGSVLDALIAQLPGVEIRDGGKIYVNGRYVDALLLNGKDFFKGNKEVMMENIGVYAVKDIQVYEKMNETAKFTGSKDSNDLEYVMDVKLKKDYMAGLMMNASAAYGTSDRFEGRLFALRYANNSRLSLYGNANNLNNTNRPRESQMMFSGGNMGNNSGINNVYNGGVDYSVENMRHTFSAEGNVDVKYNRYNGTTTIKSLNYLADGDSYDFNHSNSLSKNFSISTSHSFRYKKPQYMLNIFPEFSFNRSRNRSKGTAATFNREVEEANAPIIETIFRGDYQAIREALVNRNLQENSSFGRGLKSRLFVESVYKIKDSPDSWAVWFETKYDNDNIWGHNLRNIAYGPKPASSIKQLQNTETFPADNFFIKGSTRYYYNLTNGQLTMAYEFQHYRQRNDLRLFQMEARANEVEAEFDPDDVAQFIPANSYSGITDRNIHQIKPSFTWNNKGRFGNLEFRIAPEFFIENRRMTYTRGDLNANPHRTDLTFHLNNTHIQWRMPDNKGYFYVYFNLDTKNPDLIDMIDYKDTSDPLNIQIGNPNLKSSISYGFNTFCSYKIGKWNNYGSIGYIGRYHDITRGYCYNSATGVREYSSYNVNGNNFFNISLSPSRSFGVQDKFRYDGSLSFGYTCWSSMIGTDSDPELARTRNYMPSIYNRIGYNGGNFSCSYTLYVNPTFSSSTLESEFSNTSTGTVTNSFGGNVKLPKNFNFSTDLNIMSTWGYLDKSQNRTKTYWNAQLSYTFGKGKWTAGIQAYDILRQIDNVTYTINALGRTQTITNVLPRYILFKIAWRFDQKPKRNK